MTSIGVVGLGYWGPNLARNFDRLPGCELAWLCDASEGALERFGAGFPGVRTTSSVTDLLDDDTLDAIVLATPVPTHADMARQVLDAGKHCFVEKPLAQSVEEAEGVVEAARAAGRVLMVGHLLEYHPGVEHLSRLVDSGELGRVRYIYSNRLNLGQLRRDENALWSLGAHDVSVILRLAGEEPYECRAVGESYVNEGVEDVVSASCASLRPGRAHALLARPQGAPSVVGSKRMATFDDMELERKLTVYDKGFDEKYESYGEYIARSGDIFSPRVANEEPLRIECRHFLECVATGAAPRSDGEAGLRVVRVLETLQQSLQESTRAAPV